MTNAMKGVQPATGGADPHPAEVGDQDFLEPGRTGPAHRERGRCLRQAAASRYAVGAIPTIAVKVRLKLPRLVNPTASQMAVTVSGRGGAGTSPVRPGAAAGSGTASRRTRA